MTFKFKSPVTGDIIMLTDDAQRLLEIVGKPLSSTGIIQPEEMDGAITALETAALEPAVDAPFNEAGRS